MTKIKSDLDVMKVKDMNTENNNKRKIIEEKDTSYAFECKKLCKSAKVPFMHYEGDAGFDLFACMDDSITIKKNASGWIPLQIAVKIPRGYVGIVKSRSSLSDKLSVGAGVIDSGYRGHLKVLIHCLQDDYIVDPGMKIAQLVIIKIHDSSKCKHVESFDSEEDKIGVEPEKKIRGEKGFGSSK